MQPDNQPRGELMPAAPPTAPIQKVETRYTTAMAVQNKRSLPAVLKRLEEEAVLSGDAFFYGWGSGKDKVEGPTVKLANAAVRCYGNCAIEMSDVQETHDAWIFTAIFIDLETGFTLPRQFRQSKKWVVYGKFDENRKEDIRFQIGQSKAIRNLVVNALPAILIDRAMEVAKEGARNKLVKWIDEVDRRHGKGTGLVQGVDLVLKGLGNVGVTEAMVFSKFEIAARQAIDIDRLVILRADIAAIERGEARAEELYPVVAAPKPDVIADKLAAGMGKAEEAKAAPAETNSAPAETKSPKAETKKTGKNQQQHMPGVDDPDLDAQAR